MNAYFRQLGTAVRIFLLATLLLGVGYPVVVYAAGQLLAPAQAAGSIITINNSAAGSAALAQPVSGNGFFYPRPSAAEWDPSSSAASNLGPNSADLAAAMKKNRTEVATREHVPEDSVPIDAVTASGSGLDPDISNAYAQLQAPRVAAARGLSLSVVQGLIAENTNNSAEQFLGQTAVNTTALNAALASLQR